jgi:hypothetical protein
MRGRRKQKRTRQGQLSWQSRCWCLICEPAIPAMMPPMIVTPAIILSFFIIFSLKNFAFSGGEGGAPSDIELCEGANPSNAVEEECVDSDPSECPETGSVDVDDDGGERKLRPRSRMKTRGRCRDKCTTVHTQRREEQKTIMTFRAQQRRLNT